MLFCRKEVLFDYINVIYQQNVVVAMGAPLVPVLADIFIIELQTSVISTLCRSLLKQKRYVDDTCCYVKNDIVNDILNELVYVKMIFIKTYNWLKNWQRTII